MFVNNASGQRGLVCLYDVVCFDEVSGVSFDQKDGVNIMKGYMESGEFSRGKESIRAYGSIVMVGNFDVDVQHQQRIGHLFGPMPPEMRNDTALMDRIHCYLPGWDVPKISEAIKTNHFGLVSDFISECWTRLRSHNRISVLQGRLTFGGALSGRDQNAAVKTINGLLKLMHPSPDDPVPDEDLEWAVRLALECRRRVKEQQKRIGSRRVPQHAVQLHVGQGRRGEVRGHAGTAKRRPCRSRSAATRPGLDHQPWQSRRRLRPVPHRGHGRAGGRRADFESPGTEGVLRIRQICRSKPVCQVGGTGWRSKPKGTRVLGAVSAYDASKGGQALGVAALLAMCSTLINRSLRGGLVVVGALNLGGSIDPLHNALDVVERAVEKGASIVLMPVTARKQLFDLSDDMATKVNVLYYGDVREAFVKAIAD